MEVGEIGAEEEEDDVDADVEEVEEEEGRVSVAKVRFMSPQMDFFIGADGGVCDGGVTPASDDDGRVAGLRLGDRGIGISSSSFSFLEMLFAMIFESDFDGNPVNTKGNNPSAMNGQSHGMGVRSDSSFSNCTRTLTLEH
jgi:hypothetical protein